MKLEVGKYYRTRDGKKVGPIKSHQNKPWSFTDGRLSYKDNGRWHLDPRDDENDLIAEWTDTPEVGTLAEIGARVGDEVHRDSWWGREPAVVIQRDLETNANTGFRIISSASDAGPVRTVTRTTREIVPGRHWKYKICKVHEDSVTIQIGGTNFKVDELRRLSSEITAIADALESPST